MARPPSAYYCMTNEGAWPSQELDMARFHRVAALALMLVGLGGCIVAPAPPPPPVYGYDPGYGYGPGYYTPGYAVYPPPVSVGIGLGFGGGRHWR
jgi:hypothetical protein